MCNPDVKLISALIRFSTSASDEPFGSFLVGGTTPAITEVGEFLYLVGCQSLPGLLRFLHNVSRLIAPLASGVWSCTNRLRNNKRQERKRVVRWQLRWHLTFKAPSRPVDALLWFIRPQRRWR